MLRTSGLLTCLALVVGLIADAAGAATFYVRSSGSNTNDGLTPERAFASVRHGARFLLNPGDRLIVGPGDYVEGNIEPRRGGVAGRPVELLADVAGAMTGDAPGAVRILPRADRLDETTGFIVFGKSYVHIRGFQIEAARDAGIQVRPAAQSGARSDGIEIRDNRLLNCRIGIDVTHGGGSKVAIENNVVVAAASTGIAVSSPEGEAGTALITSNRVESSTRGISLVGQQDARISRNQLDLPRLGINISGGRDILIDDNLLACRNQNIQLVDAPSRVTITANQFTAGSRGVSAQRAGAITVAGNQFSGVRGGVFLWDVESAEISLNTFARGSYAVDGGVHKTLVLSGNEIAGDVVNGFNVSSGGALVIDGSTIASSYRGILARGRILDVTNNHLRGNGLVGTLQGQQVRVSNNRIEAARSPLFVDGAATAEIGGNIVSGDRCGLWYRALDQKRGKVQFSSNTLSGGLGIRVGRRRAAPAVDVGADHNIVSGSEEGIRVTTTGSVEISDNVLSDIRTLGMRIELDATQSDAVVRGNSITESAAGLVIEGTRSALVHDNQLRDIERHGCVVSRSEQVTVTENRLSMIGDNAIAVSPEAILPGDCNRDARVERSELLRGVQRLFDPDPAGDCSALSPQTGGRVSVINLIGAVEKALAGPVVRTARFVVASDNQVESCNGIGILAYASQDIVVHRNRLDGIGSVGISAHGPASSDFVLADNFISEAGRDGLLVGGGRAVTVQDNVVLGTGESGLRARDSVRLDVRRNEVSNVMERGLFATAAGSWMSRGNHVGARSGALALIGAPGSGIFASLDEDVLSSTNGTALLIDRARLAAVHRSELRATVDDVVVVRHSDVLRVQWNSITGGADALRAGGLDDLQAVDALIAGNLLTGFHGAGIDARGRGRVSVLQNHIEGLPNHSGAGIAVRQPAGGEAGGAGTVTIDSNLIQPGNGDGILVENAARAFVWNNQVAVRGQSGIRAQGTGRTEIVNSLTYGHGEDGVRLDGVGDARVFNNTFYGNGRWGLVSQNVGALALFNNIFDANAAGDVVVGAGEAARVTEAFNLTTGAYVGLSPSPTDIMLPPLFVDPDGADDELGTTDDDFHLQQDEQGVSPAVDAGTETAEFLGISGSTAIDGRRDVGAVDLGFHYDAAPRLP